MSSGDGGGDDGGGGDGDEDGGGGGDGDDDSRMCFLFTLMTRVHPATYLETITPDRQYFLQMFHVHALRQRWWRWRWRWRCAVVVLNSHRLVRRVRH